MGYVGTHGMAHKLDFILDCANALKKSHPHYHFLLVGNGAEKNRLIEKQQRERISNVTFLDSVEKSEVVEFLSIIDIAIINLRKSELFKTVIPSKIFETAAMQIPILIGVDGEARSIIEKFEAGLYYEPENKNDFISKIEEICISETLKKCKEGGIKLANAYNRKRLANKMLKTIKTCC